jgi:hypothetical protein
MSLQENLFKFYKNENKTEIKQTAMVDDYRIHYILPSSRNCYVN